MIIVKSRYLRRALCFLTLVGTAILSLNGQSASAPIKSPEILEDSDPKLYYIACGKYDFLYPGLLELLALYDEQEFKYMYHESGGGHSWNNWRLYLSEVATLFFK